MEESRKRNGYEIADESSVKRARTPATSGDDNSSNDDAGDDILSWLSLDEETVDELKKMLETEVTSPVKVKFIDDPYSSPLIFQSSYVTINVNEESCGSSFSVDSDCSVMASIDLGGIKAFHDRRVGVPVAASSSACGTDEDAARYFVDSGEEERSGDGSKGRDCFDWDDEVLARFLGEDVVLD